MDYKDLTSRLREYSAERRGEIADLTYEAAVAIGVLEGRVKVLEERLNTIDGILNSNVAKNFAIRRGA